MVSLIDVGSGDGTSSREVVKTLAENGRFIENLALVDADTQIFPGLVGTVTEEPAFAFETQVLEFKRREVLRTFLDQYEGKYDKVENGPLDVFVE